MDLHEIQEMPEFEADIDALTLSKLNEPDRLLAIGMSKLRQEVRWVGEKTIIAHNLSIQNARFIKRFGGPITLLFWALTAAGGALIAGGAEKWLGK